MITRKSIEDLLRNDSLAPRTGSLITQISKRGSLRGEFPVCGAPERVSCFPYTCLERYTDVQLFVSWLGQNNDSVRLPVHFLSIS
jgi:hypothetical protein